MFQKASKYLLIILGLFMFSSYVWLRFIRKRLPRDIPFNLSTLGFIILVYICCIYAYVVFSYMRENYTPKPIVTYLVEAMYKPLKAFDSFIKNFPGFQPLYLNFMVYLSYKFKYMFQDTSIFYFVFGIFPRLVLITALFIDTFWFHELFYIYKVLLVSILLFLRRYMIYCFKNVKELLILQQEPYIKSISTIYVHSIYMEFYKNLYDPTHPDYDEESDNEDIPPTMNIPLYRFIEFQTNAIVYDNEIHICFVRNTNKYWDKLRMKYNVKPDEVIPWAFNSQEDKKQKKEIKNILQISTILTYYDISNNINQRYNNLYKLIFSIYFMCWLYILIISSSTLPIDSYIYILDVILYILFTLILLGNYLFLFYLCKVDQIITNDKKKDEGKVKAFMEQRDL